MRTVWSTLRVNLLMAKTAKLIRFVIVFMFVAYVDVGSGMKQCSMGRMKKNCQNKVMVSCVDLCMCHSLPVR